MLIELACSCYTDVPLYNMGGLKMKESFCSSSDKSKVLEPACDIRGRMLYVVIV